MQIKRYLDDKAVTKGDRLFNNQGEAFAFLDFEGGLLKATSSANLTVRKAPADFGCYVLHKNRTEAGIAKERLRSYREN
jgi:hypothetical protein